MTAKEPLSYEPAGSIVVILSVVPMVSVPLAEPPPPPLLLPLPLEPLPPPQAVRASAVTATPAVATSARRPLLGTDLTRYLDLPADGSGSPRPPGPMGAP